MSDTENPPCFRYQSPVTGIWHEVHGMTFREWAEKHYLVPELVTNDMAHLRYTVTGHLFTVGLEMNAEAREHAEMERDMKTVIGFLEASAR